MLQNASFEDLYVCVCACVCVCARACACVWSRPGPALNCFSSFSLLAALAALVPLALQLL